MKQLGSLGGLFDFVDDIPDDYEPKQRLSKEETEAAFLELSRHPLFIQKIPENIEDYPELQALQNLAYDDNPESLAKTLNERGNEIVKSKGNVKYFLKKAQQLYTDALAENSQNKELVAKILSNRALVHFKLKNYKCCIQDCRDSIDNNPNFLKPYLRCAASLYEIMRYSDALKMCQAALKIDPNEKEILSIKEKSEKELDKLRQVEENEKQMLKIKNICNQKGIVLKPAKVILPSEYKFYKPQAISIESEVPLKITVPIVVTYPEFLQRDFIQYASEDVQLIAYLEQLFEQPLPWDKDQLYNFKTIEIYIELDDGTYAQINSKAKIIDLMRAYKVSIKMILEIIVVCSQTEYYKKEFRHQYQLAE